MIKKSNTRSHKKRLLILFVLIAVTVILFLLFFIKKNNNSSVNSDPGNDNSGRNEIYIKNPEYELDGYIDSVLYTFGIKKDWINTTKGKQQKAAGEWFTKTVLIPKDLTSAEVNLDINYILSGAGLKSKVTEDILTKDITISIMHPDTLKQLPAAVIQVTHSDRIKRESGIIAIIIDKVSELSSDDVDKLFITKNEFSYIFPRSLDEIEIQHKLMQNKKDIVINLTMGSPENYEADFNPEMDNKTINERVRSFSADFGSINKVLLTKNSSEGSFSQLQNRVTAVLMKYGITVLSDSMLSDAYNSNDNNKLKSFFGKVIQKAALKRFVIARIPVDKSDFDEFYNNIITNRKLGYKFVNLGEYFKYLEEEQKSAKEKEEKIIQEQQKEKKQGEKKVDVKIPKRKKDNIKEKDKKKK